jgi:aryl-alcohol dehydrogenase-like predicted oxidoreductase
MITPHRTDSYGDMNRLALGTVQFGQKYGINNQNGRVSLDEAKEIIAFSRQLGLLTLDTAIAYGDSEQRLGVIGVEDWQVISKLPAIPILCNDIFQWVREVVVNSLLQLKVKNLYGLLLHRPQQLLEPGGDQIYRAILQLKQVGLVQKIGISIYDYAELDAITRIYRIDLVQAPFNIIDRRLIDSGWLFRLENEGIELHVRSVFLQGLLLMNLNERPQQFGKWSTLWSNWDNWLEQTGLNPLQACLRYVLSFPQISKAIVGVDSLKQFKQILNAFAGPSPQVPEEINSRDISLISPDKWSQLNSQNN